MKCPNLGKQSSSLKQRYRYIGRSRSSFSLLEYKDLYFSHPTSCYLYLECNEHGNVKTFKCSNQTYFSPFYQMCVHPSIANCFKHYPLSSNLFPYLTSIYALNKSNENAETDDNNILETPVMANYRFLGNSTAKITIYTKTPNTTLSIDQNFNISTSEAYSNINATSKLDLV